MANQWILPGVVVGVIGIVIGAMVFTQEQNAECPGHWHSSFGIFIEGERVSYANYNLENGQTPFESHLHQGNDYLMHYERGCISLSGFLDNLDTSVSNNNINLDGNQNIRGNFEADENNTVVAFMSEGWGDWQEVSVDSVRGQQIADGARVLIAYGDYTEEQIQAMQSQIAVPSTWANANPPS